jgi:hypothetical protein
LLEPFLVDNVQLCCIALDLVASHIVSGNVHSELMELALFQLAVRPGRLLCGHSASNDQPYALATRTIAPRVHGGVESLDDRAVRDRLARVCMPATAQNVALYRNSNP